MSTLITVIFDDESTAFEMRGGPGKNAETISA